MEHVLLRMCTLFKFTINILLIERLDTVNLKIVNIVNIFIFLFVFFYFLEILSISRESMKDIEKHFVC